MQRIAGQQRSQHCNQRLISETPRVRISFNLFLPSPQAIDNATRLSDDHFREMCALEGCLGVSRDEFAARSVVDILVDRVKWQFASLRVRLSLSASEWVLAR